MKKAIRFLLSDSTLSKQLNELKNDLPYRISEDADTTVTVTEGDSLTVRRKGANYAITYSNKAEFFRSLSLLSGVLDGGDEVCEKGTYSLLSYMADMSRNAVFNMPAAKQMIRYLALMGYNSMMLYTEDTYELPNHPYFGHMRGRFSAEELKELDDYAFGFGIELIPCVQTLAHLTTALRWPEFDGFKDSEDILMVGDDRTYALVEDIIKQNAACFRSRRIHIGMDEAHMLARGEYLKRNGYRKPSDVMLEHLTRVLGICKKYGMVPMMWSDMFFRMAFGKYCTKDGEIPADVVAKYPKDVELVYWDYYTMDSAMLDHMMECHKKFNAPIVFADGAWKWSGFAPHNRFSLQATKCHLDACQRSGIHQLIVTGWGDNGAEASQFSILPCLLYNAERCYATKEVDNDFLEMRAQQCFGIGFGELMAFDLPNEMPETPKDFKNYRNPQNPCKYLLYNDPLERIMDCHCNPATVAKAYTENAEKLEVLSAHPTFGYIFETLGKLCRVLSVKADMGCRLYEAYQKGDLAVIKKIANEDIPFAIDELNAFLKSFRTQWYRENKTFGFIAQELRIGGLTERLRSVRERLNDYASGNIDRIEELEYQPLPVKDSDIPYISYNNWHNTTSAGLM